MFELRLCLLKRIFFCYFRNLFYLLNYPINLLFYLFILINAVYMDSMMNNLLNTYDISRIQRKYVLYFMEFHKIIKYLSIENAISFKVKHITNSSLILEPIVNSKSTILMLRQRKIMLQLVNMNENNLLSRMIESTECLENNLLLPEEELIIMEDPTVELYITHKYKELKYENTRLYYNGYHTTNINTSIYL